MSKQSVKLEKDNVAYTIVNFKDRSDLRASIIDLDTALWPKFYHVPLENTAIDLMFNDWSEYQVAAFDEEGKLMGVGLVIPISWDGNNDTLPLGWYAAAQQGIDDWTTRKACTALTAYAIMVDKTFRRRGISNIILQAVLNMARSHGFHSLMVCARPVLKTKYPLIPIEQYAHWTTAKGELFDPWLRVHSRAGANLVRVSPSSVTFRGTISQWQEWTNMEFPASGQYIVEGALAPIIIDHERDLGVYDEPNVWMVHSILPSLHKTVQQ